MEASTLLASGLHLFTEGKLRNTLTGTGPQLQGELLEPFRRRYIERMEIPSIETWHCHIFQITPLSNYSSFAQLDAAVPRLYAAIFAIPHAFFSAKNRAGDGPPAR
jgi:hypothetical protein